ncbi:MAG TPA: RdgB/HAM1 family non-canonical purine NTP pyrophosphatase [Oculatellaceae cyanobacterium]
MRIVIATTNPGKLRELKEIAQGKSSVEFVLAPEGFHVEETGTTFIENAVIKAKAAAEATGLMAVADDSGIEVKALDGRPGIHSARYCDGSDRDRRVKLLDEVKDVPAGNREAAFVCAMAICVPTGQTVFTTLNRWEGELGFSERGENGFGYDPIFVLPLLGKTSAEISPEEKNRMSHRGQAFEQVLKFLQQARTET